MLLVFLRAAALLLNFFPGSMTVVVGVMKELFTIGAALCDCKYGSLDMYLEVFGVLGHKADG